MKKYGLYAFHLLLLLLVVQVVWVLIWNYFFFLFSMVALLIPWLLYPEYLKGATTSIILTFYCRLPLPSQSFSHVFFI